MSQLKTTLLLVVGHTDLWALGWNLHFRGKPVWERGGRRLFVLSLHTRFFCADGFLSCSSEIDHDERLPHLLVDGALSSINLNSENIAP